MNPSPIAHTPSHYDLHAHSTASDGSLSPAELVAAAQHAGVRTLALTDHDTTAGLAEAHAAARQHGIELVPGIEISVSWERRCFHIIGLCIDPTHPPLRAGIERLQQIRRERAEEMGRRLEKCGIESAYEGALRLAAEGMITRSHFARYLVESGVSRDPAHAFDHYLARGKPAYINSQWAELEEAVGWISGSGGNAVLAHPQRYRLSGSWMRRLLTAFKDAGGSGIEVVCGNSNQEAIHNTTLYARRFGLAGSVGSDFHTPQSPWVRLGKLAPLPHGIVPIWKHWPERS